MSNQKISELIQGVPLETDIIPYVDLVTGTTKKALKSELKGLKGDTGATGSTGATGPAGGAAPVVTTIATPGLDTTVPSEKAVRTELDLKSATSHNHTGTYAPALSADDNYVTDTEKTAVGTIGSKMNKDGASSTGNLVQFDASGDAHDYGWSPGLFKRATRVVTTTNDATSVIDVAVTDDYELTAMSAATEFSTTGAPYDGQMIMLRFKDDGTTRALTWTGITALGVTLPTTTTPGKWHLVGIKYFTSATAFKAIAASVEA